MLAILLFGVSHAYSQTITLDTHLVLVQCNSDTLNFTLSLDSTTSTHDYTVQQLATFQPEDTGGSVGYASINKCVLPSAVHRLSVLLLLCTEFIGYASSAWEYPFFIRCNQWSPLDDPKYRS